MTAVSISPCPKTLRKTTGFGGLSNQCCGCLSRPLVFPATRQASDLLSPRAFPRDTSCCAPSDRGLRLARAARRGCPAVLSCESAPRSLCAADPRPLSVGAAGDAAWPALSARYSSGGCATTAQYGAPL